MQNLRILLAICFVFMIGSCDTDFDLNNDWEEIAVVYSLLDQSSERQYVRVGKAFLGESNAFDMAAESDSINFENATVVLNSYSEGNLVENIELTKVDATTTDLHPDKEEGIFANVPYILYHTDEELNENYTYEVVVTTDQGEEVKAQTELVSDFVLLDPQEGTDINLLTDNRPIKWKKAGNAGIYGLDINFTYREEANNDPSDFEIKTVVYPLFANFKDEEDFGEVLEFDFFPDDMLTYIAGTIGEEGSENFKRLFQSLTYTYYAGNGDLTNYFDVATSNRTGVGSSGQAKPIYTNIEGGVGLVAARFQKTIEVDLSPTSLDKLICGDITKNLRFVYNSSQSVVCD